jgi:Family of unknown function (DUF5670)
MWCQLLLLSGVILFKRANQVMRNLFHTIASFSFVIWVVGYFAYDVSNCFHYLLIVAIVAAVIRLWVFRSKRGKKTTG